MASIARNASFGLDSVLLAAQLTESSATTHATTEAVDACRYFAGLIVGALTGASKTSLVAPRFARVGVAWDAQPLCERVSRIAAGSYVQKTREQIRSTWYVLHTLEAALWSFASTDSFDEGALLAVNLARDADTTGAVYGQLAGAFYGHDAIRSSGARGLPAR